MRLDAHLVTVSGRTYRVIPDAPGNDPLDPTFASRNPDNRWNTIGESTLYLAGDPRVAAAEWARHVRIEQIPLGVTRDVRSRRIFEVQVRVDAVLDLREQIVCAALSLEDAPMCFLRSKVLCRAVASTVRRETRAQALLVPSMGLLDQPERWIMVLFVDKLPSYPEPFITSVSRLGVLPGTL